MDELQNIRTALAIMEQYISLRQVALQSGINYITLRNIKSGKSTRITEGVRTRFKDFHKQFESDPSSVAGPRGIKPTAPSVDEVLSPEAAAIASTIIERKTVAPKPKVAGGAATTIEGKRKVGRPRKIDVQETPPPSSTETFFPNLLGDTLTREIAVAEARLDFLKQLQKLEAEFLKKIGK